MVSSVDEFLFGWFLERANKCFLSQVSGVPISGFLTFRLTLETFQPVSFEILLTRFGATVSHTRMAASGPSCWMVDFSVFPSVLISFDDVARISFMSCSSVCERSA